MKFKSIIAAILLFTTAYAYAAPQLPFIGTRYYNYMKGSGTGESITIYKNGSYVVKGYGFDGESIGETYRYRGKKFTNPFYDGYGYNKIIGNKIYQLEHKNDKIENCNPDDSSCVSVSRLSK